MSRLVSRILLSISLFPLAGVLYVFVVVAGEFALRGTSGYRVRETELFLCSDVFTWLFIAAYWFILWRSSVRWSSRRVVSTAISVPAAVMVGVVIAAIAAGIVPTGGDWSFGAFVGGVVAILLWLIATVLLWRETAAERAQRLTASSRSTVACPTCGYNLTGLSEARCPECGSRFTLDELIALQPKAEVEIE
ncbi:MAG TPA: hypothetical protein VGI81_02745 [Tepidisphaeraceae bacterium]|jgi:uncharacterized paraquat-inducible protein A